MLSGTLICCHFQFFSLEHILFDHNSVPRVNVKLLILLLYRKQINYYAWYWKWVVRLALGRLEKYTHYFKWYLIYMYNSVFKIICNIQIANTASRKTLLLCGFKISGPWSEGWIKDCSSQLEFCILKGQYWTRANEVVSLNFIQLQGRIHYVDIIN